MTEDQVRTVRRSTRTWREPTLQERLDVIQGEIKKLDDKIMAYDNPSSSLVPTQELYDHLKLREKALFREIQQQKEKDDGR